MYFKHGNQYHSLDSNDLNHLSIDYINSLIERRVGKGAFPFTASNGKEDRGLRGEFRGKTWVVVVDIANYDLLIDDEPDGKIDTFIRCINVHLHNKDAQPGNDSVDMWMSMPFVDQSDDESQMKNRRYLDRAVMKILEWLEDE